MSEIRHKKEQIKTSSVVAFSLFFATRCCKSSRISGNGRRMNLQNERRLNNKFLESDIVRLNREKKVSAYALLQLSYVFVPVATLASSASTSSSRLILRLVPSSWDSVDLNWAIEFIRFV